MLPDAPVTHDEEDGPEHFSLQADEAAKLVDSVPPQKPDEILAVVRVMVDSVLFQETRYEDNRYPSQG